MYGSTLWPVGQNNLGVSFAGGSVLEITGRNFASEPGNNQVYFKTSELSSHEITFPGTALTGK